MAEESTPASSRTLCVVIDTNIWRSSRLLSNPVSASLLYAIGAARGRLGLPEVIEREVFKHGAELGREACVEIEKHLGTIRALIGHSPAIKLPADESFRAAVAGRLKRVEHLIHRVPFTTETALKALDRVDLKYPPAHFSQQFKDCAIWESCLDMAQEYDVHLVTADKAFYQQSKVSNGLETRLAADLVTRGVSLPIYPNLESLLEVLAAGLTTEFDAGSVSDAVHLIVASQVQESAERSGWVLLD